MASHRARAGMAVLVLVLAHGCTGRRAHRPDVDGGPGPSDSGQVGDAGSGLDSGGDTDGGGSGMDCTGLPAATTTSSGVLTAYPGISYFVVQPGYSLRSVNFVERGGELEAFAEVVNGGGTTDCDFIPQMTLDGTTLDGDNPGVNTPPYYSDIVNNVTKQCLAPGDVGVLHGFSNTLTLSDLGSGTFEVDLGPHTLGTPYRATNGPTILSATPTMGSGGWTIGGQIQTSVSIRNYLMLSFGRDARGLLVGQFVAYPMMLGTLPGGATIDYESDPVDTCPITDALQYQTWIVN